ncbi:MAG: hypothetical protein Q9165_000596 [Trypethelium subeluteriae]
MPRLNYTNRKSEGLKLGQIVAKDLRKRAKSFHSKGEKQPESATLELDISGRKIDDEGLLEIISALDEVARDDGLGCCNKLEELNFSQNRFTTKSLAQLASVIRSAQFDLQVLDVSYNEISVKTDDEAQEWEAFLESFRHCYCLRRIDFSGNDLSGPRAFEVLARVYGRQIPADPADLRIMSASVISVAESETANILDKTKALSVEESTPESRSRVMSSSRQSLSQGTYLTRRCGLRSVPYLIFRDVSLTNAGALFLSYLVQHHYFPDQLMTRLSAASAESKREEYSQEFAGGKGVIYAPYDGLNKYAVEVLESAELARTALLTSDDADLSTDKVPELVTLSNGRRISSITHHKRRLSVFSLHSSDESGHGSSELDSKRYKAQRTTIEDSGAYCVELWSASLTMLVKARAVLFDTGSLIDSPVSSSSTDTLARRGSSASLHSPSPLAVPHNTPAKSTPGSDAPTHSYASTLMIGSPSNPNEPSLTVAETTPTKPTKPYNLKFIHPRRSSTLSKPAQHTSLSTETTSVPIAIARTVTSNSDCYLDIQRQRMDNLASAQHTDGYRDSNLPETLPLCLWTEVLALASGAEGLLSADQKENVVHWAQQRQTLTDERGLCGKGKSVQIWRVLDGMGCLNYEIRL